MKDKLLTHKQAAEILGLRPKTLYEWVQQRRISVIKLSPRCNRYKESEIRRIIEEREVPAAGE